MTAYTLDAEIENVLLRMDDYIPKPIDTKLLYCKIKDVLNRRHKEGSTDVVEKENKAESPLSYEDPLSYIDFVQLEALVARSRICINASIFRLYCFIRIGIRK